MFTCVHYSYPIFDWLCLIMMMIMSIYAEHIESNNFFVEDFVCAGEANAGCFY